MQVLVGRNVSEEWMVSGCIQICSRCVGECLGMFAGDQCDVEDVSLLFN